jgi:hypothetical protein
MRQDMKDLLVNTGRYGNHSGNALSRRARLKKMDIDDLPSRLPSGRHRVGDKEQGDRLKPLRRFLTTNCGRLWDDVYKEICAVTDSDTIRGYHLRQHVWNYVVPNNYDVGHNKRYGPFFVDVDGTLQEKRKLTEAERLVESAYWRKRTKWRLPPSHIPNPRIAVDADHWYEKIKGYWFAFETKHYTYKNSCEDLVKENGEIKIVRIKLKDVTEHVTTQRQVNGKTQKKLDASFFKKAA